MPEDSLLKQHVVVQAIEIASKPLKGQLSQATDEEEIQKIKAEIKDLRYDELSGRLTAVLGSNNCKTDCSISTNYSTVVSSPHVGEPVCFFF